MRRSAVQVYIVGVRKFKFYATQAVFLSGPLTQKELTVSQPGKRLFAGLRFPDAVAAGINDIVGILCEVGRVLLDLWHEFIALDFQRHVPGRTEENRQDLAFKQRRRVVICTANDDIHREGDVVLFVDNVEAELGNVHDDGWAPRGRRKPPPAFKRQFELNDTSRDRGIEFAKRRRIEHAGGVKAVSLLETLDRLGDFRVVAGRPGVCRVWKISKEMQEPAQPLRTRVGHPRFHGRPGIGKKSAIILVEKCTIGAHCGEGAAIAEKWRFDRFQRSARIASMDDLFLEKGGKIKSASSDIDGKGLRFWVGASDVKVGEILQRG